MRRSRYREEQIIGILKEHQAGLPAAELCRKYGVQRRDVLQVAVQVRRHGGIRRQEAEGAGG